MDKAIKIMEVMVNSQSLAASPFIETLAGKVVSVSIRNMEDSTDRLLVGWNEDPSTKNVLAQGESIPYGPYAEGQYLHGNELKLAFENNDASNAGLVSIATETDEEVC